MTDGASGGPRRWDRAAHIRRLRETDFDLLVIGGGISGVAVARDAARRGLKAGLIEAHDFAFGTSSRSSRLVHGGLRYLEHFELDLVFEASQERRTLLRIAPHLVRPLEFYFPIFEHGRIGKRKLDAGMWLYDALSLFRNVERHQMLDADELLQAEPHLRSEGLLGGARYYDAQVDDARLVITTARGAAEDGAVIANRVEAIDIDVTDWPGHRVRVRDRETNEAWWIDALSVVNATGPWAERTQRAAGLPHPDELAPSRGTHIHVPTEQIGHRHAFIFESPLDHRVMFVLPWRDLTLIGTTDEFHEGDPESVAATPGDIAYLLESTNELFPQAGLSADDVVSAWAGLRPLVAPDEDEGEGAGDVSRDFEIHQEPDGFFTLMGGKLTSHRAMAEETVDHAAAFLASADIKPLRKCDTARVALPGGRIEDLEALQAELISEAAALGVSAEGAARLTRAYGTRAREVLELVSGNARLAERIDPGRPHILAEVVHAARAEMALHAQDVLYRRTRVGLEVRDPERPARRVAEVLAAEFGWDDETIEREIDDATGVRAPDDRAVASTTLDREGQVGG